MGEAKTGKIFGLSLVVVELDELEVLGYPVGVTGVEGWLYMISVMMRPDAGGANRRHARAN